MKRLVNESLDDILKPKSRDEILQNIGGRNDATFEKTSKNSIGTYAVGQINVSYNTLVKLFGEPQEKYGKDDSNIADRISTRWTLEDDKGQIYTIYDYKSTSLYDYGYPSPEAFRRLPSWNWHIGGMYRYKNRGGENLISYIYLNISESIKHL